MCSSLSTHNICFGAEIDCCKYESSKQSFTHNSYMELKTTKILTSSKDVYTFERYKLLKFWAQSVVAGIEEIVCGFRDNDILKEVQYLETSALPSYVAGKKNMWDPKVCLNFLDQFLSWLKANISTNTLYSVEFTEPFNSIQLNILPTQLDIKDIRCIKLL